MKKFLFILLPFLICSFSSICLGDHSYIFKVWNNTGRKILLVTTNHDGKFHDWTCNNQFDGKDPHAKGPESCILKDNDWSYYFFDISTGGEGGHAWESGFTVYEIMSNDISKLRNMGNIYVGRMNRNCADHNASYFISCEAGDSFKDIFSWWVAYSPGELNMPISGTNFSSQGKGDIPSDWSYGELFLDNPDKLDLANACKNIPDDKRLDQINLCGTHDSATFTLDGTLDGPFQCQNRNWEQQFALGARCFDLRLVSQTAKDKDFPDVQPRMEFYHGTNSRAMGRDCNQSLAVFVDHALQYLKEHPTEFFVCLTRNEHGHETNPIDGETFSST